MRCPHCHEEFPLHVKHSRTSKAAGEARVFAMTGARARIMAWLMKQPLGGTDEEIAKALALNPSTERPRRVELVAMGQVSDTGETRETESGTAATVWAAVRVPNQGRLFA